MIEQNNGRGRTGPAMVSKWESIAFPYMKKGGNNGLREMETHNGVLQKTSEQTEESNITSKNIPA